MDDHPALARAAESGGPIVPLVVLDPSLRTAGIASRRVERYDSAVAALDRDLRELGGRLIVRTGSPETVVASLAREVGAREVVATRDLTPRARRRDAAVDSALQGVSRLRLLPGTIVVEPEDTGEVRVFAAFNRRWLSGGHRAAEQSPRSIKVPDGIASESLPAARADGGREALQRLGAFQRDAAAAYGRDRNKLDRPGTSHLSPDLHFGTLSPLRAAETDSAAFVRQIAWRDWAHHLVWFAGTDDRASARRVGEPKWIDDVGAFDAWREGRTGYPTVDAAMRQLSETGWIPNRARLVVASFLTKHLLIDWRRGEAHFHATLIDGDVANNRLGWRWTSGVGHDAAPFVRVLNPVLQGQRFDPEGEWVRQWLPEIRDVPDDYIHNPWDAPAPPLGYPAPIVDHKIARGRALAAFADRERPGNG